MNPDDTNNNQGEAPSTTGASPMLNQLVPPDQLAPITSTPAPLPPNAPDSPPSGLDAQSADPSILSSAPPVESKKSKKHLKWLIGPAVIIVLVIAWLLVAGVIPDWFRTDGEGADPTLVRTVQTCLSHAMLAVGGDGGIVCGNLNTGTSSSTSGDTSGEASGGEGQLQAIRFTDADVASGQAFYQGLTENISSGSVAVILEDSDEMFKFLQIIGDDSYVLRAYYRGKKLQADATDLTLAEDALVQLGAPSRNRSDSGELATLVEEAKKERRNIAALAQAKYYMELSTSYKSKDFPSLYGLADIEAASGIDSDTDIWSIESVFDVDENSDTGLASVYRSLVKERGSLVNYAGEKLYFAAVNTARPDLMLPGAIKPNQILFHYYAECLDGTVVPTTASGKNDRPLFAITFPHLDHTTSYCITGNRD